jgi:hypothetical protein
MRVKMLPDPGAEELRRTLRGICVTTQVADAARKRDELAAFGTMPAIMVQARSKEQEALFR